VAALLAAYGIPTLREIRAHTAREVLAAAREIGFPVVLKAEAPDLVHKTDAGGVRLNLRDEAALASAQAELAARFATQPGLGFLVQPFVTGGRELIVGAARAADTDGLVMFGLGGTAVEVYRDVAFALAPLGEGEAAALLDGIRAKALLGAFRGQAPLDRPALIDLLRRVGRLIAEQPRIAELDLNPVLAYPGDARLRVIDARLRIAPPA
jgi:acetyltransferase